MSTEEDFLSENLFEKFSNLVYNDIGIHLPPHKRIMLEGRIKRRIRKLKINSFEKYYELIIKDEIEKIEFFNVVSTNKTEFFREKQHFDILEKLIPDIIKNNMYINEKKISIWSAASSSGEEAYSILMMISEKYEQLKNWKLKVIASDISTLMLEQAKNGIYADYKLENLDEIYIKKYFERYDDKHYKISESLKKYLVLKRINLKEEKYPFKGEFEIVFCRNILIYFDHYTKVNVLKNILNYLKKNGILVLGSMEPLSYNLEKELGLEKIDSTIYRKIKEV